VEVSEKAPLSGPTHVPEAGSSDGLAHPGSAVEPVASLIACDSGSSLHSSDRADAGATIAAAQHRTRPIARDFGQDFSGLNFAGLDLSYCDFSGCSLRYCDLSHSDLSNCCFEQADLTGAKPDMVVNMLMGAAAKSKSESAQLSISTELEPEPELQPES
jgi:hypothetical protein